MVQLVVFYFLNNTFIDGATLQNAFCFITGLLLITYTSNLFYADKNFIFPNLILSVFNIAFVLFIWLHKALQQTIISVYFFIFLLEGLMIALAYIIVNQCWRTFALPNLVNGKKFFHYSLTVLLFNVLLFLVYRVDYYFVRYSAVSTPADLGNYIQAS